MKGRSGHKKIHCFLKIRCSITQAMCFHFHYHTVGSCLYNNHLYNLSQKIPIYCVKLLSLNEIILIFLVFSHDSMMNASTAYQALCPICKEEIEELSDNWVAIQWRGANGINEASVKRKDDLVVQTGAKVHKDCRKHYTNVNNIKSHLVKKSGVSVPAKRTTRQSSGVFDSGKDCIFCGCTVELDKGNFSLVRTDKFVGTILEVCECRSDDWGLTVKGRIEFYLHDLHAADGLYHHSCSINFRTLKSVPLEFQTVRDAKRRKSGRPIDEEKYEAFQKTCAYLELNSEEQLTVASLSRIMNGYLSNPDSEPYDNYSMKKKLKEHFKDSVHFSEAEGLGDIVTMREQTSQILRSYHKQKCQEGDEESQKRAIIETADRLIKSDIKSQISTAINQYPSSEDLKLDSALSFIPTSLRIALETLFVGKDRQRKVAAVGHAIIQAVRPRAVLAPLQVGLAVQIHHLCRSKFIVETLHKMGFCSSYAEVIRFEKNAADCVELDVLGGNVDLLGMSVLFAADNVDHNIITIDGKGTFHGMGIIAALTPAQRMTRTIQRKQVSDLKTGDTKIPVLEYRFARHACREVVFKDIPRYVDSCLSKRIDILWEVSLSFKEQTPIWQGMMHTLHQGSQHSGQSSVRFFPMINLYSGDKSCILSTLDFVCNLAISHNLPTIVTFDQPLYWKAAEIIIDAPQSSHLKGIVLMLGCFHTLMNLLGAIGTLMEGTGLSNILETVYGGTYLLQ